MIYPSRLIIHNSLYALDGGTTYLQTLDEIGQRHSVVLVQLAFPQTIQPDLIPGRLYFDGELIPMRSASEVEVLTLLRTAEFRAGIADEADFHGEVIQLAPNALIFGDEIRDVLTRSPDENLRVLTSRIIEFIDSELFLTFADRVEQAADEIRYTVWVYFNESNRKQVMVRLAQANGIGLQGAREFLEQNRPIGTDTTAIEVSNLANRYRKFGLDVKVEPAFRWKLP